MAARGGTNSKGKAGGFKVDEEERFGSGVGGVTGGEKAVTIVDDALEEWWVGA